MDPNEVLKAFDPGSEAISLRWENVKDLIVAWRAWDLRPGNEETSKEMEDQCALLATHLGIATTNLRITMGAKKAEGLLHAEAIKEILDR